MLAEEALTIEIIQRLPVPEYDTPLENLVKLRGNPAFRRALDDLLEWKRDKAPAIVLAEDRKEAVVAVMRDFNKLTKTYAEVMEFLRDTRRRDSWVDLFFLHYGRAHRSSKGSFGGFPGSARAVLEKKFGDEMRARGRRVSLLGSTRYEIEAVGFRWSLSRNGYLGSSAA